MLTPGNQETAETVRPRRRRDKAATRQRLLDAAIAIMGDQGADALTTVNVTEAAEIVQSAFYLHFGNIDECEQAAAQQVAGRIRGFIAEHRHTAAQTVPGDIEPLVRHYRAVLDLFQSERRFSELLVRCRHDRSPVGTVLRQLVDDLRSDLIADWQAQFTQLGFPMDDAARLAIYAELILGMVMAAGEALIDGRCGDPDLLARELARSTFSMAVAALSDESLTKQG